jgi:L-fucose mutarotase/ribose pyranase (RbsD/FucU family)
MSKKVEIERQIKIFYRNSNQKRAAVARLMTSKVNRRQFYKRRRKALCVNETLNSKKI